MLDLNCAVDEAAWSSCSARLSLPRPFLPPSPVMEASWQASGLCRSTADPSANAVFLGVFFARMCCSGPDENTTVPRASSSHIWRKKPFDLCSAPCTALPAIIFRCNFSILQLWCATAHILIDCSANHRGVAPSGWVEMWKEVDCGWRFSHRQQSLSTLFEKI